MIVSLSASVFVGEVTLRPVHQLFGLCRCFFISVPEHWFIFVSLRSCKISDALMHSTYHRVHIEFCRDMWATKALFV